MATTQLPTGTDLERAARAIEDNITAGFDRTGVLEVSTETHPGAYTDLIVHAVFDRAFQHRESDIEWHLITVIKNYWQAIRTRYRLAFR